MKKEPAFHNEGLTSSLGGGLYERDGIEPPPCAIIFGNAAYQVNGIYLTRCFLPNVVFALSQCALAIWIVRGLPLIFKKCGESFWVSLAQIRERKKSSKSHAECKFKITYIYR
jgi:hypothetical protein